MTDLGDYPGYYMLLCQQEGCFQHHQKQQKTCDQTYSPQQQQATTKKGLIMTIESHNVVAQLGTAKLVTKLVNIARQSVGFLQDISNHHVPVVSTI